MSPAPLTIEGTASLTEAAYMMMKNNARRLVVEVAGKVAGVIREQDLFFEMERILRNPFHLLAIWGRISFQKKIPCDHSCKRRVHNGQQPKPERYTKAVAAGLRPLKIHRLKTGVG
jgi:hypothetical protein